MFVTFSCFNVHSTKPRNLFCLRAAAFSSFGRRIASIVPDVISLFATCQRLAVLYCSQTLFDEAVGCSYMQPYR